MRYPWHVSAVVGVLLITGLRPCTRHVPAAPAVGASMPSFSLASSTESTFTESSLLGETWIAGFVCDECEGAVSQMGPILKELAGKIVEHKKPLRVLAISPSPPRNSTANNPILRVHGPKERVDALRERVVAALGADKASTWNRTFIIDDQGKLRGAYALGELGADEVYHRAQHVARDAMINRANHSTSDR